MEKDFKLWLIAGLVGLIFYSCSPDDKVSDPKYKWEFLSEFKEIVLENSIFVDSVDQNQLEMWAINEALACKSTRDYYWVARDVLFKMGDFHSYLMTPTEVWEIKDSADGTETYPNNINFSWNQKHSDIPYIAIKGIIHETNEDIKKYADSLNSLIKYLDKESSKGWVIDLRENEGGDFSSMFLGIAPFINEDTTIFQLGQNGFKESTYIKDGFEYWGPVRAILPINVYQLMNPNKPVAVLIGPYTASAGEFIAVALGTQENSRLFGSKTTGLTTGMRMFQFNNGAIVNLARSVLVDKNGKRYGGKVEPDYYINFKQQDIGTAHDSVLIEAIRWIEENSSR